MTINGTQLWPWWQHFSRYPNKWSKCRTLAKLLVHGRSLKNSDSFLNKVCSVCEIGIKYELSHLLFVCKKYETVRQKEWEIVVKMLPNPLVIELDKMAANEKTCFIMCGLRSKYVPEFQHIYDALLDFICNMITSSEVNC